MSKPKIPIFITLLMCAAAALFARESSGQYVEVSLEIDAAAKTAAVRGRWAADGPQRLNLSFLAASIGAPDLGSRVSEVRLIGVDGRAVNFRRFNSSEYVAESDFSEFAYLIDLNPLSNPRSAAHSSWIAADEGLLFVEDLVPLSSAAGGKRAIIGFKLPPDWRLVTAEKTNSAGKYDVENVERSVFVLGKKIRGVGAESGPFVAISGQWLFGDDDAAKMSAEIYNGYVKIFDSAPATGSLVAIMPMPQAGVQKGTWEAETRGSTVAIASADMPFKSQSVQRLHEQLRHEIFHLWLPNGMNLTGRYDWFYEGFALYQSLKTAASLNQIRFEDFLDTLSRAHNIDRSQTKRRSLIEASQERWAGADTQVYARGMVVGFLCDLALLQNSKGKSSVETIFRKLYSRHKYLSPPSDANTAVLKVLEADSALAVIANDYIRGAKPIEWTAAIEAAGLENDPATSRTSLRIKQKLNGRQKDLLDKLGYNNWRKLTLR